MKLTFIKLMLIFSVLSLAQCQASEPQRTENFWSLPKDGHDTAIDPTLPYAEYVAALIVAAVDSVALTPEGSPESMLQQFSEAAPENTQDSLEQGEPNIDCCGSVEVSLPDAHPLGTPLDIQVLFLDSNRKPLPNAQVSLRLENRRPRLRHTDADGSTTFQLGRNFSAGGHNVTVVANDLQGSRPITTTGVFTIQPGILTIRTVPPLPGIGFSLSGRRFYSDIHGTAQVQLTRVSTYSLELLPTPTTIEGVPTRVEFARWLDNAFTPNRAVKYPNDAELTVGFVLSYQVDQRFTDLDGNPIDASRVISFTLKDNLNTRYIYEDPQPRWHRANRVSRQKDGLITRPIDYRVESVIVDGMNVVNENQQRFDVIPEETWPIELLLYSMRIQARDAVLGTPIGTGVEINYPDGYTTTIPFNEENEIAVHSLARGLYKVQVKGADGMAPLTPVSLSRDQDVELKVLSALDMRLGLMLGLSGALGLLFLGRPTLLGLPLRLLRRILMLRRTQTGRATQFGSGQFGSVQAKLEKLWQRIRGKYNLLRSLAPDYYQVAASNQKDSGDHNLVSPPNYRDVERFRAKETAREEETRQ
jgi:hypothetical protein